MQVCIKIEFKGSIKPLTLSTAWDLQFSSNVKSTSVFGEVNNQAFNLALISYCHLSVTSSSQYLMQPTDLSIRIPLPPSASLVGWDNTEKETETAMNSKLDWGWQYDAAVEKAMLVLWCIK